VFRGRHLALLPQAEANKMPVLLRAYVSDVYNCTQIMSKHVLHALSRRKVLVSIINTFYVLVFIFWDFDQLYSPTTVVDKRNLGLYHRKKSIRSTAAQKITTYYNIYKNRFSTQLYLARQKLILFFS